MVSSASQWKAAEVITMVLLFALFALIEITGCIEWKL